MKRKITFFGICVLFCTLVISLGSCQKDYSGDIDQLKADVAANKLAITSLNSAITAGKLITQVTAITGGYTIKFSDNTTINITNGTNGTNGTAGFTPVLGVDANGYWTVKTTATGTPTQLLDAGGLPIKAKLSDQLGINSTTGFLTVGGVVTTVSVPMITLVTTTTPNTLLIKFVDATTGLYVSYNVLIAADVVNTGDIIGIVSPIGITKAKFNYGYVPGNTAGEIPSINPVTATTAGVTTALTFAGVTYDALLRAEGKLPIIINPAQASLVGYKFEVVKQGLEATPTVPALYALQPDANVLPTEGFTGAFIGFNAAASSNGLYTLTIKTDTKAKANAARTAVNYPAAGYSFTNSTGESYELAIRATKGTTREIFSGYQYAIQVNQDINTDYTWNLWTSGVYTNKVISVTIPPDPAVNAYKAYVAIGETKDLLDFYLNNATAAKLKSTDFYKSAASIISIPGNTDIESFVTMQAENATTRSRTTVSTTNTSITVSNLNDRVIPFKLQTFDWRGMYYETKGLSVVFYSAMNNILTPNTSFTHVLTASTTPYAKTKTVLLANPTSSTAFFAQTDALGKTELWRTNAYDVEVKLTYGTPAVAIPGVTYEFLDQNGNVVSEGSGTWGPKLSTASIVEQARKIRFIFAEGTALPGSYTAVLQYKDRRPYAGTPTTYSMPFVIENPDLSATFALLKTHKANLFEGADLLTVYGTYPTPGVYVAATAQTNVNTAYYDLFNAYQYLYYNPAIDPADLLVPTTWWKFVKITPTPTTPTGVLSNPLTAGIPLLAGNTDRYIIEYHTMYTNIPYSIKLVFYYFANVNNSTILETIRVQAKSEVKEGSIVANTVAKPAGWLLPATLQVTNGDLVTAVPLSFYYKAQDYLGFNLKAFGRDGVLNAVVAPVDTRIDIANTSALGVAKVEVISDDPTYAHLVAVTAGHPGAAAGVMATAAIAANPLDFTIKATNAVAVIQADVVVPITVKITDIFGQVLTTKVNVTVKKP